MHRKENEMKFEEVIRTELIKAYVEAYGMEAWETKTAEEQQETLHELLGSFLTVARRNK